VQTSAPSRWAALCSSASGHSPRCSRPSDSAENDEKVVKPPSAPVTSSRRSVSSGQRWNQTMATPISAPPRQLTSSVPSGNPAHRLFSAKPAPQRASAPAAAPSATAAA